MRKWPIRVLAFCLALLCIAAVPYALRGLPVRQKDFLTRGRPQWEGIVTLGVVESFDQGGFYAWLSARAREFEKAHRGVLLSVRRMGVRGYQALKEERALPDAVVLGPFVETGPSSAFLPISGGSEGLRQAPLQACQSGGAQYGLPLALGAYGLLCNQALLDGMQIGPQTKMERVAAIFQEQGRELGCPAPGFLRSDLALNSLAPELASFARVGVRAKAWPEFALDKRTPIYIGTQREVLRMHALQSAGKGFTLSVLLPRDSAYTDQLLCLCAVQPSLSGHGGDVRQRLQVLGEFTAYLLDEEAQAKLAGAGLFSSRAGLHLYGADENMAALEGSLELLLEMPNLFASGA